MIKKIIRNLKDEGFADVAKGGAWSIILLGLTAAVQFLFDFSLARIAGPDLLGVFYLCVTILSVTAILGRIGFDRVLIKFIAPAYKHGDSGKVGSYIKTSFLALCVTGFILTIALYSSASFIANDIYDDSRLEDPLRLFSLALIPFLLTYIIAIILRSFKRIPQSVVIERLLLQLFTLILIVVSSVFMGADLIFVSYAVSVYLTFIVAVFMLLRYAPNSARDRAKSLSTTPLFKAGLYMLLVNISLQVISWSDVLIVGYFEDTATVAIYNVALKISLLMSLALTAINIPVGPRFAELYHDNNKHELQKTFKRSAYFSVGLAMPLFIILMLFPTFILGLFGAEFEAGATALRILAIGQAVNVLTGSVDNLLTMTGKEKAQSKNLTFIMVLNICLNLILIPSFGIVGAATATAISIGAKNLVSTLIVRSKLGIKLYY